MAVINTADEETVKREAVRQRPPRSGTPSVARDQDDEVAAQVNPRVSTGRLTRGQVLYQRFYQLLDAKSGGKAADLMRLIQFLIVGGSASVLNLVCVAVLDAIFRPNGVLPVFFATAAATEISLLFNFVLNDRFTFRNLVNGQRTWAQRCLRFHGPASVGFILTLLISNSVHHFGHQKLVVSQAIAIVIVTMVNFFMHRNWTYREAKGVESANTWAE